MFPLFVPKLTDYNMPKISSLCLAVLGIDVPGAIF
jgi:hypothetical protein